MLSLLPTAHCRYHTSRLTRRQTNKKTRRTEMRRTFNNSNDIELLLYIFLSFAPTNYADVLVTQKYIYIRNISISYHCYILCMCTACFERHSHEQRSRRFFDQRATHIRCTVPAQMSYMKQHSIRRRRAVGNKKSNLQALYNKTVAVTLSIYIPETVHDNGNVHQRSIDYYNIVFFCPMFSMTQAISASRDGWFTRMLWLENK